MTDIPSAEESPTTAAERLYRHLCRAYTARDLAAVLKDYDDALAEARATPPAAEPYPNADRDCEYEPGRDWCLPHGRKRGEHLRPMVIVTEARATPPAAAPLPLCPICGKDDLFIGRDGKPGCPHCEVGVVLPTAPPATDPSGLTGSASDGLRAALEGLLAMFNKGGVGMAIVAHASDCMTEAEGLIDGTISCTCGAGDPLLNAEAALVSAPVSDGLDVEAAYKRGFKRGYEAAKKEDPRSMFRSTTEATE